MMRAFGAIISIVGISIIVIGVLMFSLGFSNNGNPENMLTGGIAVAVVGSAWLIFGLFLGCLADIRKYLEEIRNALYEQSGSEAHETELAKRFSVRPKGSKWEVFEQKTGAVLKRFNERNEADSFCEAKNKDA